MNTISTPVKNRAYKMLAMIFVLSMLNACNGDDNKTKTVKTYQVQSERLHKSLHFTGIIQPIRESSLTNPMEAVIEDIHIHYGQKVKKNDVVFTLNSSELQRQYNDTLTEYLKSKDNYTMACTRFSGTKELWAAGLISKNNFLSEKSALNSARIALVQATRKLTEMLEKMEDSTYQNLSALSFAEFDKVRLALNSKHNLIRLKSPGDGVLLYPPKSGEDKKEYLTVGKSVKTGEVLALIGDLSGIRVEINIPEVDIYKIKPGMPAIIHSIANPKETLKGELVAINAQASIASGSALPSFTATVEVKHLNPSQQAWIKVGMSAEIELIRDSPDKLLVPISAIEQQHGQKIVRVKTQNGQFEPRVVTTSVAQADKVVIDSGLKPGEIIAYH